MKYVNFSGARVSDEDPKRLVWLSARCSYWTDDWDKVGNDPVMGIPCCPYCGSPGYQIEYDRFRRCDRADIPQDFLKEKECYEGVEGVEAAKRQYRLTKALLDFASKHACVCGARNPSPPQEPVDVAEEETTGVACKMRCTKCNLVHRLYVAYPPGVKL